VAPVKLCAYNKCGPKYVIAMGALRDFRRTVSNRIQCAQGIDRYFLWMFTFPAARPRPEALMHAFMTLQASKSYEA
jgi:NADH:ubiquinone oxidoreductase subunit B-like Fe-S oxidoreductase